MKTEGICKEHLKIVENFISKKEVYSFSGFINTKNGIKLIFRNIKGKGRIVSIPLAKKIVSKLSKFF